MCTVTRHIYQLHSVPLIDSFLLSPNKLLRSFPALQADQIKNLAVNILRKIPDDVYAEIISHAK